MCIEKIKNLFNAVIPSPENVKTEDTIRSNGKITLLKKIDGTYCLKDEFSGCQKGHFLTKDEAIKNWEDLVNDDNLEE